jgi:hypothetical protein
MPTTPHIEKHFSASAAVRDIVIGMADGLTVRFALAAGLSGAASSTAIMPASPRSRLAGSRWVLAVISRRKRIIQPAHIIAWSFWRRAHQAAAQRAHFR